MRLHCTAVLCALLACCAAQLALGVPFPRGHNPTADKVKPVADKVQPAADKVKPVADKVQAAADKVKPVADKVQAAADKVKPVADKVQAAADKVKPVADKVKPVAATQDNAETFLGQCSQGEGWIRYNDYCYRYYEEDEYWYVAEQNCKGHGGNLVSIGDKAENSFVAKLTYCEAAWTGRYAVHVDRLQDPSNYRFTDGTVSSYHAHDFTSINSIHDPLVSVFNLTWRNNVYHSRHRYVCKVPDNGNNGTNRCQSGWKELNGSCYLMPQETATYIEASFYCSGRSAHLVSVHNAQELRAASLLDVESEGCPATAWIGLIKINPCRIDFSTGKKICYKWADRQVDFYDGFPAWHPGNPDEGPRVNCVLLKDRAIMTVECYERHRFICKKPVGV